MDLSGAMEQLENYFKNSSDAKIIDDLDKNNGFYYFEGYVGNEYYIEYSLFNGISGLFEPHDMCFIKGEAEKYNLLKEIKSINVVDSLNDNVEKIKLIDLNHEVVFEGTFLIDDLLTFKDKLDRGDFKKL